MAEKPIRISRARLARLTGRTPQAVSQWLADGLPHEGGGHGKRVTIELDQALPWLLDHRGTGPGSQRERLAKEQADKLALENAASRGELVYAEHVDWLIAEAVSLLKQQILGLPGRLATQLASMDDPALIRSHLQGECRQVLESYRGAMEKAVSHKAEEAERCDQK